MDVMTARPLNHIGPGQSDQFVVTAFARQLAALRAAAGADPVMYVGNLDTRRDFTDVRDVARAYRLLLEQGRPGHAYNIASGRLVTIRALLDQLCTCAGIRPRIEIDPQRYRPADETPVLATSRLRDHVGWRPEFALEETLRDVYAEAEAAVSS